MRERERKFFFLVNFNGERKNEFLRSYARVFKKRKIIQNRKKVGLYLVRPLSRLENFRQCKFFYSRA